MAADDRIAELIVRLSTGDSVAQIEKLKAAMGGVSQEGEKLATTQEKVSRSFAAGSTERWIASMDKSEGAIMRLSNGLDQLRRREEAGEATSQQRAQVIDLLAEKYKKEQAAIEAKAEAEKKAAQIAAGAVDSEKQAINSLLGQYDKQFAAEQRLNTAIKDAATIRQSGRIGLVEEIALRDKAQVAYKNETNALAVQEAAMRKSATSTGLARYELINFSRQVQDIGVSLAGGQSPLRVLIEQGSQIADIFISSKASIASFFGQIATWGRSSTALLVGFVGAVASIGVGAISAAASWSSAQKEIQRALLGIGAASGVTVNDINKIAEAASSTKFSTSEATEAASAFAATGKIYKDNIQAATALTYDFAKAMGKDTTEAAKMLAAAMVDPIKGVEELEKSFGAIDGATRAYIRSLQLSGQEQKAQHVLLDTFREKIEKAASLTSIWAKIWDTVTTAASSAYTAVGKALSPASDQDKLVALQAQLAAQQSGGTPNRANVNPGRIMAQSMLGDDAGLKATKQALDQVGASIAKDNAEADKQRLAQWAKEGTAAIRETIPQIVQLEALQRRLTELQRADPAITENSNQQKAAIQAVQLLTRTTQEAMQAEQNRVAAVSQLAAAYTAAKGSAVELLTAAQNHVKVIQNTGAAAQTLTLETIKQVSALNDQIKIAQARTGEEKALATEKARTTQLTLEGKSAEEAALIASKERKLATEQANSAVRDQITSIRQGVEMERAMLEGTEAATAAAQAYANAMRSGADSTTAAALAAATLAANEEKAQIAAEKAANNMATQATNAVKASNGVTGGRTIGGGFAVNDGTLAGYAKTLYDAAGRQSTVVIKELQDFFAKLDASVTASKLGRADQPGSEAYAQAQQAAAELQMQAAQAQQQAAETQKQAAETLRQQNNVKFQNIAAQYLINGVNPLAINAMIESGQIARFDASTTFQTQLDLYKRAGVSNARTRSDILGGIIGEGVAPTELLAALDGLKDAVTGNTAATEAQTVGLSPFYSQQGDRLLGYRGYSVNNSPSGSTTGTGTTTGGTGTTNGTGAVPYGGVVNGGAAGTGASNGGTLQLINGQWVQTSSYNTYTGLPTSGFTPQPYNPYAGSTTWQSPYYTPRQYAEGGIATSPTYGVFGEAGPEAFVPLRGGKIPVHLAGGFPGNDNAPVATALPAMLTALFAVIAQKLDTAAQRAPININAPLVQYGAEPSNDKARETAFQSGQLLRRVIASAA